jgi:hypothetical protein
MMRSGIINGSSFGAGHSRLVIQTDPADDSRRIEASSPLLFIDAETGLLPCSCQKCGMQDNGFRKNQEHVHQTLTHPRSQAESSTQAYAIRQISLPPSSVAPDEQSPVMLRCALDDATKYGRPKDNQSRGIWNTRREVIP